MTDSLCEHLNRVHYPKIAPDAQDKKIAAKAITDIRKTVLGMWKD